MPIYWRPNVGRISPPASPPEDWVIGLIERHFGHLTMPADPPTREVFGVPGHSETLFALATDAEATNSQVRLLWKQPARVHRTVGTYRQSLVERLYNGMFNARLYELGQQAEPPFAFAGSGNGAFVRTSVVKKAAGRVQSVHDSPATCAGRVR